MPVIVKSIRLIHPLRASDNFEGCDLTDTNVEESAVRFWDAYRAAVAGAYPDAVVTLDTPWQQYDKPHKIDIETDDEYSPDTEDEVMRIHRIGEAVFERGDFWVAATEDTTS